MQIAEKLDAPVKSVDNAIQRIRKKGNKRFNTKRRIINKVAKNLKY